MNECNQHHEDEDLQAPTKLVEALVELHNERIYVPSQVTEAILGEARAHLGKQTAPGLRWSSLPRWSAIAASFVLLAWLVWTFIQPASRPDSGRVFAREDINQDGRVDILDAFVLARDIDQKGSDTHQWDFNGDGVIDRSDADLIANRAVKLEKGGRS